MSQQQDDQQLPSDIPDFQFDVRIESNILARVFINEIFSFYSRSFTKQRRIKTED